MGRSISLLLLAVAGLVGLHALFGLVMRAPTGVLFVELAIVVALIFGGVMLRSPDLFARAQQPVEIIRPDPNTPPPLPRRPKQRPIGQFRDPDDYGDTQKGFMVTGIAICIASGAFYAVVRDDPP